jgi:hypothetical protein
MATAPQPPRPPVAPPPPRSGSHILAIVLLVLALIVLVSVVTVWTGLRFLARSVQVQVEGGAGGKKEVSIKTPVGSLEVRSDISEAQLGLPIYPGAKRMKDKDSATVNLGLPGKQNLRIVAAKFETADPLEKVRDFYKHRLGSEVTKFTEKNQEGNTVFEIKHDDQEKVVALESKGTGTQIALLRVTHAPDETN